MEALEFQREKNKSLLKDIEMKIQNKNYKDKGTINNKRLLSKKALLSLPDDSSYSVDLEND